MNKLLWVLQVLLALLFVFSGVMKFLMPVEQLTAQSDFSVGFLRFIGVCEVLGAIGLVVPWATGILRGLTPLAAALLVIIMIGAVVTTLQTLGAATAVLPLVALLLVAFVAWGRWRTLRQRSSATRMAAA